MTVETLVRKFMEVGYSGGGDLCMSLWVDMSMSTATYVSPYKVKY